MDARPAPCRMRVGEAYAQPAEPRRPIAVDPPLVGAGRRRGRHVKAALAHGRTLAVSATACSTHPGSSAAGWRSRNHPRTATRRRIPGHPGAGAPPARRRTGRNPRLPAVRRRGWRALPYAAWACGRAARPAAGHPSPVNGLSFCGGPRASRCPRQLPGVRRDGRRATAAGVRPGGGECGPLRAALKDRSNARAPDTASEDD